MKNIGPSAEIAACLVRFANIANWQRWICCESGGGRKNSAGFFNPFDA